MGERKAGTFRMGYPEAANKHICFECGGAMAEVERVNEDGFTFIWYRCVRIGCKEQWLEKRAMLSPAPANLVEVRHRRSA